MVAPIVGVGVGIARGIAMRTLAAEGAILGKAWWGFKSRREIVAGIRTGLGLGAGIGSFINDESSPFDGGKIQTRNGFKANKFRQKHFRRNFSKRRRCNCHSRYSRSKR